MQSPGYALWLIIYWCIRILQTIIFIDVILTWIPSVNRYHPLVRLLRRITEPIYRPVRRLLPPEKTGYLDLSPLIIILGLGLIGAFFRAILIGLLG